jgi:hypothetical protein
MNVEEIPLNVCNCTNLTTVHPQLSRPVRKGSG